MSGITLRIGIEDKAIIAALKGVERRGMNMLPLMDEIGGILVSDTLHNFETGTAPDGTPWKQSKRIEMLQGNGQTLIDTAHLRNSITHIPGNDQVEVGSNLVYAGIHQEGGATGRNHAVDMPARPYLGISPGAEAGILAAAQDYLSEPLGGAA